MSETIAAICSTATELPEVITPAWVLRESMRRGCTRAVILEAAQNCDGVMAPEVNAWLEAASQKLGTTGALKVSDAVDALPPPTAVAVPMIESALDETLGELYDEHGTPAFVRAMRGWVPLAVADTADMEHSLAWMNARLTRAGSAAAAFGRIADMMAAAGAETLGELTERAERETREELEVLLSVVMADETPSA